MFARCPLLLLLATPCLAQTPDRTGQFGTAAFGAYTLSERIRQADWIAVLDVERVDQKT